MNCPWHGRAAGRPILSPASEAVRVEDPSSGFSFFARRASAADVDHGERLAGQLRELVAKIVGRDEQALLAEIPDRQLDWLRANGYNPVDAWLDRRLTEIILNRGRVVLTPELVDRLPPPDQQVTPAARLTARSIASGVLSASPPAGSCVCADTTGVATPTTSPAASPAQTARVRTGPPWRTPAPPWHGSGLTWAPELVRAPGAVMGAENGGRRNLPPRSSIRARETAGPQGLPRGRTRQAGSDGAATPA